MTATSVAGESLAVRIVRRPPGWVVPLRASAVFASTRTPDECYDPLDTRDDTAHFVAVVDGTDVGVATVARSPRRIAGVDATWRLSNVGVEPSHRHEGIGGALVAAARRYAARHGGTLWVEAPASARAFYTAAGAVGDARYDVGRGGDRCDLVFADDAAIGLAA